MLTTNVRFILFAAVITILVSLNNSFEPPFLQACTIEDEQCQIKYVDKFFEMYGNGIEELNVTTLDPMHLGDITINGHSNENFNLQLIMKNVDLYKFPVVKCRSIKGFSKDPTQPLRMVLKMISPQVFIKAHCLIKGKLLFFTVAGETDLKLNIQNVSTTMKATCLPYQKDGVTYYKSDEMKPRLEIGRLRTSFANSTLFNGEQIFMETFAATINENWEVFRDEIEPHINTAVAKVATDALNKVLAAIPYEKFFKKSV